MNEFFLQFFNLWELFCIEIKNSYIENKEKFFINNESEPARFPQKLYDDTEIHFWRLSKGKGCQWYDQFEEKFHLYNKDMFVKLSHYETLSEEIAQIPFTEDEPNPSNILKRFIYNMEWKYKTYRVNRWSECFDKTWMPALKKRGDEIIQFLHEVDEKSKLPIDYYFEFDLKHKVLLQFEDTRKISNHGMNGLDGYQYTLNGRTYTDISSLHTKDKENITDNVYITEDIYGCKALSNYTSIPTFDSGDREWDSRAIDRLMFDGKDINLVEMRGGYKIASLTFYYKLLAADVEMKSYFERLGYPIESIVWIEKDKQ